MSLPRGALNAGGEKYPNPNPNKFAIQNTFLKTAICRDLGNTVFKDFNPISPVTPGPGPNSSATNVVIGWDERSSGNHSFCF